MGEKKTECKFCKMMKERKEDVLFENEHIFVVFGRPHHKGHLVVCTKRHETNIMLLRPDTLDSYLNDTMQVCRALNKAIKYDRLNFEYLDNWDPHIHMNIYPRFMKDKDWGQPPYIPGKKEKFKEQYLNWKEIEEFRKELECIKSKKGTSDGEIYSFSRKKTSRNSKKK
jgi:diadenosine tetraphosphate (Ap4A) HIT family hydrolase